MESESPKTQFIHTGFASPITEVALILVSYCNGVYQSLGSAVVVGSGLALTAAHVVQHHIAEYGLSTVGLASMAKFSLQAILFRNDGPTSAHIWDVQTVVFDQNLTDVALLTLVPRFEEQREHFWRTTKLQLLPPTVGTRVSAFGYHSSSCMSADRRNMELTTNPYTTSGTIQEIYDLGRDKVMLPFPCFRTDFRADGAMSGGPVFNEQGNLCGLICAGTALSEPDASNAQHSSYVSLLWPLMGLILSIDRLGQPSGVSYPMLELAQAGLITAVDWQSIVLGKSKDPDKLTVGLQRPNPLPGGGT